MFYQHAPKAIQKLSRTPCIQVHLSIHLRFSNTKDLPICNLFSAKYVKIETETPDADVRITVSSHTKN